MKRVLIIGCPGAGKSTFARKLAYKTHLPLHYLDMIWHRRDRTIISTDEFDAHLKEILFSDEWIIDGNYLRTMPTRLSHCDTVFFFDLPVETCLAGAESRIGKHRDDMPWIEDEMDEEFRQSIIDFPIEQRPKIIGFLEECGKDVIVFKSREDADDYLSI